MIRTVNALISLAVFGLYILHTILFVPTLVVHAYNSWAAVPGMLMFALIIVHASLSLFMVVKQAVLREKEKTYWKLNMRSLFLVISGLAILILILIHNVSFGYSLPTGEFVLRNPSLDMFIVNVLLAVALSVHCAFSLQNACLTLGICTRTNMTPVKVSAAILSLGIGIVAIVSYCLYYLPSLLSGGAA